MNLAALAAVLSLLFAGVVGVRWLGSRRPAFAAWSIGLLIFAGAAGTQSLGEDGGFNAALFRIFYLLGGVLGVIYLALGTVYLLAPRRIGHICAALLGLLTVLVGIDAFLVPVDPAALGTPAGILGDAYATKATPIHLAAVLFNIAGSLVLVGGSAWSAWRLARDRAGLDRVVCNILLTVGAFVIAAGFSAAKVTHGSLDTLGAYESVGIAVMFAGFLSLGRLGRAAPGKSTLASSRRVHAESPRR